METGLCVCVCVCVCVCGCVLQTVSSVAVSASVILIQKLGYRWRRFAEKRTSFSNLGSQTVTMFYASLLLGLCIYHFFMQIPAYVNLSLSLCVGVAVCVCARARSSYACYWKTSFDSSGWVISGLSWKKRLLSCILFIYVYILCVCVCVCVMFIHVCVCVCVYIYIYIYIYSRHM